MNINVNVDTATVQRMLDRLTPEVGELAVKRTINKVADQARTRMSREIRAEFNLSKVKVDEKLYTRLARSEGRLRFTGQLYSSAKGRRAINLINFAARQRKGRGGRPGPVTAKQLTKGGRVVIPGAFIGNDGRTVFRRVSKARLPIEPVYGLGVPHMFIARGIQQRVERYVIERFGQVFLQEARYALRKAGAI